MAKMTQAHALALAALARLLGNPVPQVMYGSKTVPGVFAGASAGDKAAANYCLDQGWLATNGESVGKGKTRKELYRITPAGLQAVLDHNDPTALLRGLAENLKTLDTEAARIPGAIETVSASVERQLGALKDELQQVPAALQEMKTAICMALGKLKPVDIAELSKKLAELQPAAEPPPRTDANWGDEVVRMAAEQKQRTAYQRLTLPQVFERLRSKHPALTLGQFHDGLRRLQDEKRIILGPYTQALATLDDPRNALFLDREVKYYVELP